MAKVKAPDIKWLLNAEEHDYPAADSFLRLMYEDETVAGMVARLRSAPMVEFKAKDILRASELSPLGISNSHVERDKRRIKQGTVLSPLLLVRDPARGRVVIADGYHRLCAIYQFDEDAWIHCKII
ncbi:hypothetical protein GETHLI_18900 [Geothrix limicola]|uniref:ParB/Sulfiredoxin domain-containing protein n=1 Tax=Geothrix limicola TaxID=2927978 RepID=A0ABQ5QFC5_9BACT|nr:hypothetical protein [Geothrix limicola]GLH73388.1 hypothetical protein GETHLI_18900 [Geothrix limicola]